MFFLLQRELRGIPWNVLTDIWLHLKSTVNLYVSSARPPIKQLRHQIMLPSKLFSFCVKHLSLTVSEILSSISSPISELLAGIDLNGPPCTTSIMHPKSKYPRNRSTISAAKYYTLLTPVFPFPNEIIKKKKKLS